MDKCLSCNLVDLSESEDCMVCLIQHGEKEFDGFEAEIELSSSRYVLTHEGEVYTAKVACVDSGGCCVGVWESKGGYITNEEIASYVIGKPIKADFDRTFGDEVGGYLYNTFCREGEAKSRYTKMETVGRGAIVKAESDKGDEKKGSEELPN